MLELENIFTTIDKTIDPDTEIDFIASGFSNRHLSTIDKIIRLAEQIQDFPNTMPDYVLEKPLSIISLYSIFILSLRAHLKAYIQSTGKKDLNYPLIYLENFYVNLEQTIQDKLAGIGKNIITKKELSKELLQYLKAKTIPKEIACFLLQLLYLFIYYVTPELQLPLNQPILTELFPKYLDPLECEATAQNCSISLRIINAANKKHRQTSYAKILNTQLILRIILSISAKDLFQIIERRGNRVTETNEIRIKILLGIINLYVTNFDNSDMLKNHIIEAIIFDNVFKKIVLFLIMPLHIILAYINFGNSSELKEANFYFFTSTFISAILDIHYIQVFENYLINDIAVTHNFYRAITSLLLSPREKQKLCSYFLLYIAITRYELNYLESKYIPCCFVDIVNDENDLSVFIATYQLITRQLFYLKHYDLEQPDKTLIDQLQRILSYFLSRLAIFLQKKTQSIWLTIEPVSLEEITTYIETNIPIKQLFFFLHNGKYEDKKIKNNLHEHLKQIRSMILNYLGFNIYPRSNSSLDKIIKQYVSKPTENDRYTYLIELDISRYMLIKFMLIDTILHILEYSFTTDFDDLWGFTLEHETMLFSQAITSLARKTIGLERGVEINCDDDGITKNEVSKDFLISIDRIIDSNHDYNTKLGIIQIITDQYFIYLTATTFQLHHPSLRPVTIMPDWALERVVKNPYQENPATSEALLTLLEKLGNLRFDGYREYIIIAANKILKQLEEPPRKTLFRTTAFSDLSKI